jgi:hypothetical protein
MTWIGWTVLYLALLTLALLFNYGANKRRRSDAYRRTKKGQKKGDRWK